jgi:4-oxalocrotonate tautomerase
MISGQEDPVLAKKLAKEISRLTKDILGKKPELTYNLSRAVKKALL